MRCPGNLRTRIVLRFLQEPHIGPITSNTMKTHRILALGIASLFLAAPVRAALSTWNGGGANDNVGTAANWNPVGAPTSDLVNTILQFGGAVRLTPNFGTVFSADQIIFLNTADAFVLGGSTVTIGNSGIANLDTQTQTINNNVTVGTASSVFSATSGNLAFNGTLALGANALSVNGANTTTFAGAITGTGTVTKSNATGILAITSTATAIGADFNLTAGITRIAPGGVTQVFSSTSTIAVSGTGTLNFNENTTLDGALLTMASGTAVNVAVGKTLTMQNGADFTVTGAFTNATASTITVTGAGSTFTTTSTLSLNGGSTTNVLAGGSVSAGGASLLIGSGTNGAVTVDGSGSILAAGALTLANATAASLTFSNGSTGTFGGIQVEVGGGAGAVSTLSIQSGATVT